MRLCSPKDCFSRQNNKTNFLYLSPDMFPGILDIIWNRSSGVDYGVMFSACCKHLTFILNDMTFIPQLVEIGQQSCRTITSLCLIGHRTVEYEQVCFYNNILITVKQHLSENYHNRQMSHTATLVWIFHLCYFSLSGKDGEGRQPLLHTQMSRSLAVLEEDIKLFGNIFPWRLIITSYYPLYNSSADLSRFGMQEVAPAPFPANTHIHTV